VKRRRREDLNSRRSVRSKKSRLNLLHHGQDLPIPLDQNGEQVPMPSYDDQSSVECVENDEEVDEEVAMFLNDEHSF